MIMMEDGHLSEGANGTGGSIGTEASNSTDETRGGTVSMGAARIAHIA